METQQTQLQSQPDPVDDDKVYILHLRRRELVYRWHTHCEIRHAATGGLTIAYMRRSNDTLVLTVARCNLKDKDVFSRKKGREQAIDALTDPTQHIQIPWRDGRPMDAIIDYIKASRQFRRNLRMSIRHAP